MIGSTRNPAQHASKANDVSGDARKATVVDAEEELQPKPAALAAAAPSEAVAAAVPDACLMDVVVATPTTVVNALDDPS